MEGNERVVVIKGNPEKWYSQAVFILNPQAKTEDAPVDLVAEAEKIIISYMALKNKGAGEKIHGYLQDAAPALKSKKRWRFDFLLYILMGLACAGLAAIVALGWFY